MGYKGIDYGMGTSNINPETGIRFGVIGVNCEHLDEWFWEQMEADYGDPGCPKCGGAVVEYDHEKHGEYPEHRGCDDYACESCGIALDSGDCYPDEAIGHDLDSDGYKGRIGSDCTELFVTASRYYTRAQFCSPCAPGACHLEHPMSDGEKAYCLGHEWFKGDRAPYPVFDAATHALVMPEWAYGFTGPDDRRHLRTWAMDGFVLEMYDTDKKDSRGTTNIAFRLTDGGEVIFQDDGFHPSPMDADDSDNTVAGMLAFLALKEGDTDSEYFANYTPRQREWAGQRAEELQMLQIQMEEAANADEFLTDDGCSLTKGETEDGGPAWTDGDLTFPCDPLGWPYTSMAERLEGKMRRNGRDVN
jgi:hypothetical protein